MSGQEAYETWRAAVPEYVCNVPAGKWDDLPPTIRAGFDAIAAQEPGGLRATLAEVTREYALLVRYLGPGATQAALSGCEPRDVVLDEPRSAPELDLASNEMRPGELDAVLASVPPCGEVSSWGMRCRVIRAHETHRDRDGNMWQPERELAVRPMRRVDWARVSEAVADRERERDDARAELAAIRELLDEVGVMAANAPEDGDLFGVLEEIAMRIGAVDVPGTENAVTGSTPGAASGPERPLAALLADRRQLREALRRIALGSAGDPSAAAGEALTASREYREQWEVLERELGASPKLGELTIAVCEIPGHAPHAARVTVDYGLQVTSFCLPPEHAEFLGDALASGKAAAVTAELHRLRELLAEALDYAERIPDAQGETMLGRAIRERIAGIRKRAGLPS
jgi:hypothetical protein